MEHVKNLPKDLQYILKNYLIDIYNDDCFKIFLKSQRRYNSTIITLSRAKSYFISEYDIIKHIPIEVYYDDIIFNRYKEVLMISDLRRPRDISRKKRSQLTRSYFSYFIKRNLHLGYVNELVLDRVSHIQNLYRCSPKNNYRVKITLVGKKGEPIKKIIKLPLEFFIRLAHRIKADLTDYMEFFDKIKNGSPGRLEQEMADHGPAII